MKPFTLFGAAYMHRISVMWASLVLLSAVVVQDVFAQEDRATTTNTPVAALSSATTVAAEVTAGKSQGATPTREALSPAVQDILKMADAGVSAGVLVAFIQRSHMGYVPTSTDLIALKEHGVPDEVTSALMKRGAAIEAQTAKIKSDPAMPAIVKRLSSGTYVDPDSYEFWYYHYAYPRALSYSYRTLAPYDRRYGHRVLRSPYGSARR